MVQREVEPGPPVTVAYSLTTAGTAVLPALDALVAWAEQNLTEERCATPRR